MRAFAVEGGLVGSLLLCREQGLRACRRIHLRIQIVSEVFDILLCSDHGRHEATVRRVCLVVMKHGDEVPDVSAIAAFE